MSHAGLLHQKGQNLLTYVDELINPMNGAWDEELIRDMFWDEDAECILGIPVHVGMSDLAAWHYNPSGDFTVRSAYKVYMEDNRKKMEGRRGGSTSTTCVQCEDPIWKRVWNLKSPKKMIHHLWRMGHNSLALRVNLWRRGMKIDKSCVMCGRYDEDGPGHICFSSAKSCVTFGQNCSLEM